MGGFFLRAHAVLVLELSNRLFPAFGRDKDGPLGQNPLDTHSSFRNADLYRWVLTDMPVIGHTFWAIGGEFKAAAEAEELSTLRCTRGTGHSPLGQFIRFLPAGFPCSF